MSVLAPRPAIDKGMLDPLGRSLHRRVEEAGYTVDIVASVGTSVPHVHPGHELIFVHSGVAVWWIAGKLRVLVPGDALLLDARLAHGSRPVHGEYVRTIIHYVPEMLGRDGFAYLPEDDEGVRRVSLDERAVARAFAAVCDLRAARPGPGTPSERLLREVFRALTPASDRPHPMAHPVLADAVRLMGEHCGEIRTVTSLARQCYVSEGHLHYLFQTHFGCSPLKMWQVIRVEKACAFLRERSCHVEQLAAATGFASRRGFQRAFKRVTGVSVERYRERLNTNPRDSSEFWS